MSQLALSFIAGSLSAFSPCVLPTFPLVAGGALQAHRLGPFAIAAGMTVSFTIVALALNTAGSILGLDGETARVVAAVILTGLGLLLISAKLKASTSTLTTRIANTANSLLARLTPAGLSGQFLVGALLGAVWMPCAGPALGAAMTLAARGDSLAQAAAVMLIFGIGASLPLLIVAYGTRKAFIGKPWIMALQQKSQFIFGLILVLFGVMTLSGADKVLEEHLLNVLPDWFVRITTTF
jgi:cytochrome c biogenesis protein CcdA